MVMSSERRRQEEKFIAKDEDDSNEIKNRSYIKPMMVGLLSLALGAGVYFAGYVPQHKKYIDEHKTRIEAQKQVSNFKENSILLAHELVDADSTSNYFRNKSEEKVREVNALRDKIDFIQSSSDSVIYNLGTSVALLSDSLDNTQQQLDISRTQESLLERKLSDANTKIASLSDSTLNLYNQTIRQLGQIAEKDQKINELTPDVISIVNGTTIEAYSQGSRSGEQNGYGLGFTTRLVNGRNSGIGGLLDLTFSSDKESVNKSLGSFLYLKDSKSRLNFELGGGYNFESNMQAETISNPYFLGAVKFDLFGVRGASLKISSKSVKGQDPTYRVGTSFGIR